MSPVRALGRAGRAQHAMWLVAVTVVMLPALVVYGLNPIAASATQSITIVSPLTDQLVTGSTLVVAARASGADGATFSIAGGGGGTLTLDPSSGLWHASVDLSSVPAGTRNVSVTATFSGTPVSDTAWRARFEGGGSPTATPAVGLASTGAGPPSITIQNPLSNHAYTGPITVRASAVNAASVAYAVDGATPVAMAYNATTGTWEGSLNTSTLATGARNVDVINTGSNGTSVSDRAWSVTIDNPTSLALGPTPVTASTTIGGSRSFGVSYSGAEFGAVVGTAVGTIGTNYIYPADAARDRYFADKGLRLVRLPIGWERLQRQAYAPLSPADLAGVRAVLDASATTGQKVIVDLHNFGRYYGTPLTVADSPKLANFWQQLAAALRGHPALYGYELMNEPHDLPEGGVGWAALAQAATNGVRQSDTAAWVLVPGYGWQTATFWVSNNPTLAIQDSSHRLQYAAHLYFDHDYSGIYARSYDADGAYPAIGANRVQPFSAWLASRQATGILTEYGVPGSDPRWLTVLDNFMSSIAAHPNIAGGTYWSSGPWWGAYPLSVEPANGVDRPQMTVLAKYPSNQ